MIYDGPSLYPFYGDPIVRTEFINVPGSLFPIGIAQKISSLQNNVDTFVNNWIDGINALTNPPYIADK